MQSVAKFFDNGAHFAKTTTWKGNFPFDRSSPVFSFPVQSQSDPSNLKRIATYISVLLKLKREPAM